MEAFKRTLLDARSIAYLKEGQCACDVAGLLERLGIAEAIQSKVTLPETDIVSELVSRGEIELGIVVITQILTTDGVALAGPLPAKSSPTSRSLPASVPSPNQSMRQRSS